MKIMITAPWARRLGGAETMLATFLRSVDRARLQPIVVFLEAGPLVEEVQALGLRTAVIPAGRLRQPWRLVTTVRALARLLEREQPDLLLNWMAKTHLYGACAALLARRSGRVVWWQHTVPQHHWLDRSATLLPARAIGCSSHHAAKAQAATWPHRPVFVVHPGIDAPPRSQDAERRWRRSALGIDEGQVVVGLVGRVEPVKRHAQFVEVIASLLERRLPVHGLVVGGTLPGARDTLRELEAAVQRRGLGHAFTFTGHVPDARALIELMDVFVSLAVDEAFGIALLEAMALGVPVIAAPSGGPREIIEDGTSGLLAPSTTPESVADAVERILRDRELRERLASGAVDRFRTRFDGRRMAADLEEAIGRLAAA